MEFAKRFIWLRVRRSKVPPEGGIPPQKELDPLIARPQEAAEFASADMLVPRNEEARKNW